MATQQAPVQQSLDDASATTAAQQASIRAARADVKDKLAQRAQARVRGGDPAKTIRSMLEQLRPELQRALPRHITPDRLVRVALTTIRANPRLMEASPASLMAAVMQCAQLGLEPGILGHVYLVPFRNGKTGQTEIQVVIGYKGMIELARRSGEIQTIYAHVVHERDQFEYEYGLEPKLIHRPAHGDRGKPTHAYGVARFKDGGYQFLVMSFDEIEKHRQRSKSPDEGPWDTDWEEMAKKTVIRSMFKWLPVSVEAQRAAVIDEAVTEGGRTITAYGEAVDVYDEVDALGFDAAGNGAGAGEL
ncbi:MAG: recombination protein RecT [Clostridia bacterium]|nr:recombination protein RecT [Clostridia bacterium]